MLIQFTNQYDQFQIDRAHITEQVMIRNSEEVATDEYMKMIFKVAPIEKIFGTRNTYGNSVCIISKNQFYDICNVLARIKRNTANPQTKADCEMILEQLKNVFSNEKQPVINEEEKNNYGLTKSEYRERQVLQELQKSKTRYMTQKEHERLLALNNKMFANAGSPTSKK